MKKEELWKIYIEKNPKFVKVDATITFTTKGLRQFFERTFDHAFEEGKKVEKDIKSQQFSNSDWTGDFFGEFFNTSKKYKK